MNLKKEGIRLFITTFVVLLVMVIVIGSLGYFIGQAFGDYGDQHYYFINNMRQNFFATGDIFPQLNMNLGLTQSMSTMIYHGYLNPYVMISYIFNNVSTQMVMSLIIVLTISMSVTFTYVLVRIHNFHRNIALICGFLFGFAPFLIFHAHYHPMYIYYYPFAILNLIAIHRLIDKRHIGLLTLSFSMIFFLNFFFAPIVTVVNIFYFILCIYKLDEKKIYIFMYIKSYIVSLLISLVILIPNFVLFLNSPRVSTSSNLSEIVGVNLGVIFQLTINPYIAAMGIIVLCALMYHLFLRHNKQMFAITLFILIVGFFGVINYFLNVFQYVHYKQLIYLMPLAIILVANFLNERNRFKNVISRVTTIFLVVIVFAAGMFLESLFALAVNSYPELVEKLQGRMIIDGNYIIFIFACMIAYLIIQWYITHINIKKISIFKTSFICILIACTSFFGLTIFMPQIEEQAYTVTDTSTEIYRDEATTTNDVEEIDSFTPTFYASMVNSFYSEMIKTELEVEVNGNERRVNQDVFNNEIMCFIFGIDDQNEEVMPMIYTKENEDLYSTETLGDTNKLLALLNGDFTTTSSNTYIPPEIKVNQASQTITVTGEELSHSIDLDYSEDGVLLISFDASNNLCDYGFICSISINGHKNDIYSYSKSLYSPNDNFSYIIDIDQSVENLEIKASVGDWTISNLEYVFIPSTKIEELKKSYVEVENFEIDINNGYTFTTNLETDGYVMTTIPYDTGFNVYVDGVAVEAEIVNNYFLGFPVEAGTHTVEITYIMPGFIFGGISTIIGIILLIIILINEYIIVPRKYNKEIPVNN